MSPRPDEYQVEGYGVRTPGYDAPYLATADFDPNVEFAHGGDPKAAAKAQKARADETKPSEFDSPRVVEQRDTEVRKPTPNPVDVPKPEADADGSEVTEAEAKADKLLKELND